MYPSKLHHWKSRQYLFTHTHTWISLKYRYTFDVTSPNASSLWNALSRYVRTRVAHSIPASMEQERAPTVAKPLVALTPLAQWCHAFGRSSMNVTQASSWPLSYPHRQMAQEPDVLRQWGRLSVYRSFVSCCLVTFVRTHVQQTSVLRYIKPLSSRLYFSVWTTPTSRSYAATKNGARPAFREGRTKVKISKSPAAEVKLKS